MVIGWDKNSYPCHIGVSVDPTQCTCASGTVKRLIYRKNPSTDLLPEYRGLGITFGSARHHDSLTRKPLIDRHRSEGEERQVCTHGKTRSIVTFWSLVPR